MEPLHAVCNLCNCVVMEELFHDYWIVNILAIFFICLLCTGLLIPGILQIAVSKQLFDKVDVRKIHKGRVPRLGGMAFEASDGLHQHTEF